MTQTIFKLTATKIVQLKNLGRYGNGAGLYLQVRKGAAGGINKSRVFVFQCNGCTREMEHGPIATFGLADARVKALQRRRHS